MPRQPTGSINVTKKIKPIKKISISEEIARQFVTLIMQGHLAYGQRLPSERDLCKQFGASRTSLREALRCLSIVGILDARVSGGTSVAVDGAKFMGKMIEWRLITEKHDVQDLLEVRIALEGIAAANMASSCTAEQIDELEILLEKMRAVQTNAKKFAALDLDFHMAIAKASTNELLTKLILIIREQLVRGVTRVLLLPRAIPLSLKEHGVIVQALKRRDPEASSVAMEAHLTAALLRYRKAASDSPSEPALEELSQPKFPLSSIHP